MGRIHPDTGNTRTTSWFHNSTGSFWLRQGLKIQAVFVFVSIELGVLECKSLFCLVQIVWKLVMRWYTKKMFWSFLVLLNEWETLIWPQRIWLGGKTYLMNGCCQTKRLKPPLFWKLPILLLLTQLNFLKFIHPREESEGTRPPARLDVGSLTNTTRSPGRGIFVFSLSANGAFLHQISSAPGTVSDRTGERGLRWNTRSI